MCIYNIIVCQHLRSPSILQLRKDTSCGRQRPLRHNLCCQYAPTLGHLYPTWTFRQYGYFLHFSQEFAMEATTKNALWSFAQDHVFFLSHSGDLCLSVSLSLSHSFFQFHKCVLNTSYGPGIMWWIKYGCSNFKELLFNLGSWRGVNRENNFKCYDSYDIKNNS